MMRTSLTILLLAGLVLAGCGQTEFPNAFDVILQDVDDVINNGSLDPQQKRNVLASWGIDEVTINGLLRDERLANQFGGSLESAIGKVSGGQMSTLTPDEVQYYGDASDVTTYPDDEAQAIVDFFERYGIDTPDDLTAFLGDPANELPEEIDQTNLEEVFINTSIDTVRDKLP